MIHRYGPHILRLIADAGFIQIGKAERNISGKDKVLAQPFRLFHDRQIHMGKEYQSAIFVEPKNQHGDMTENVSAGWIRFFFSGWEDEAGQSRYPKLDSKTGATLNPCLL